MLNWYLKLSNREWKKFKKTAPILVLELNDKIKKQLKNTDILTKDGKINTLEGPQEIKKNDVICKGLKGEYWVQPKSRLKNKYSLNKDFTSRGKLPWKEWIPNGEEVEAKQETKKESFKIKDMVGKKNDWILRDPENHKDKWIVDDELFHMTYSEN